MKKLTTLCFICLFAFAVQAGAAQYVWKFGLVDSTTNPNYFSCLQLGKYLEEAAPGKWDLQVYPSAQMGNASEMLESVQMGGLELAGPASSFVANYVPEFGVWDMPYLLRDESHVEAVMDGEVGKRLAALAESANMRCVAWWEVGFRCLANNRRLVNHPDDVKGLRLRVMSNEIHQSLFAALGADPVPMSLADAYVANQNGTIDGQDNPLAALVANSTFEVCKYIAVTNHVYSPLPVMMSNDAWESMTAEDQKIFTECMAKTTAFQRNAIRDATRKAAQTLKEKGCEITNPNLDEFAARMNAVYEQYPQYAKTIAEIQAIK